MHLLLRPCRAPPRIRRRLLSRLLELLSPLKQQGRVAGLDTLLTAAGVDNEEDADFLHPLGSAAAFPGPAAPSLKCRRDSPPGFYVTITATAAATTTCPVSPMATTIALYHGSGSPFGLIVRCSSDLGAPDELLEYDGHQCCMISAA